MAIDEDSLETGEGLAVKQAAEKFLDQLGPDDRVGVVTLPRLQSQVTLSTRRSDVKKVLDAVITGINRDLYEFNIGLAEAFDVERGYGDVLQRVIARECGRSPVHDCSELVKIQVRQMQLAARNRAQRSFDALAGLADGLSGVPGPEDGAAHLGRHADARSEFGAGVRPGRRRVLRRRRRRSTRCSSSGRCYGQVKDHRWRTATP